MLPINLPLPLMQTKWASDLNPLLSLPLLQGLQLNNISLINGVNVINHKLQRQMQGWGLVDINGPSTIYRSQPFNQTTLTLTSSAACVISLWVF